MIFLGKHIAPYTKPFIIAEISGNHDGDIDNALSLITAAKEAGADAVKIQCYTPDEMTIESDFNDFKCGPPWEGRPLYELYLDNATPFEWLPKLFETAKEVGIPLFSSVFGERSLEELEKHNCPAYKIASPEACDINFLKKVRAKLENKHIIISAGCASMHEIDEAASMFRNYNLILMHCVSKYPCSIEDASMCRIPLMRQLYKHDMVSVGFSDHTKHSYASEIAILLGASIIEKHITLDKTCGDDGAFSLNPEEFAGFVKDCNHALEIWRNKVPIDSSYRRSVYVVKDIKAGEQFTEENVRCIRPGYGLHPNIYTKVLTKTAARDMRRGEALKMEMVKWV